MLDDNVLEFLRMRLFARLSTNGRNGYPHTVPIWFDVEVDDGGGESIWFVSDRSATKTRNVIADPRATVSVGGDAGDAFGLMITGLMAVEEDPGQLLTHRMIDRYESAERAAELRELWKDDDIVVLRLTVERVVRVNV